MALHCTPGIDTDTKVVALGDVDELLFFVCLNINSDHAQLANCLHCRNLRSSLVWYVQEAARKHLLKLLELQGWSS